MLFVYVGVFLIALLLIGLLIACCTPCGSKIEDVGYMLVGLSFVGIIACLILGFIGSVILAAQHEEKWVENYRYDIVASNDSTRISGRFGLFHGYINEKSVYVYYYPLGDDKYKQGWIAEDKTTIVETKDDSGYIIVYKDANCNSEWYGLSSCTTDDVLFDLVVPEGSVIQQYQFDLGN